MTATVYVRLLDEEVDVWRPVRAEVIGNDVYRLVEEQPSDERWEFRPGTAVRCQRRETANGFELVASELVLNQGKKP